MKLNILPTLDAKTLTTNLSKLAQGQAGVSADGAATTLVEIIVDESAIPQEFENVLSNDDALKEQFFAVLANLGEGDSIETSYEAGVEFLQYGGSVAASTTVSKTDAGFIVKFSNDAEAGKGKSIEAAAKKLPVKVELAAGVTASTAQSVEFVFANKEEVIETLRALEENPTEYVKKLLSPTGNETKQSLTSHLHAVELDAGLAGELTAGLELGGAPNSEGSPLMQAFKGFQVNAQISASAGINTQARVEWEQDDQAFLVLTSSFDAEVDASLALQINALKNFSIATDHGGHINHGVSVSQENRFTLPKDFMQSKSLEDIKSAVKNSLKSCEVTQTITFTQELPQISQDASADKIVVNGVEKSFTRNFSVTDAMQRITNGEESLAFSPQDFLNTFTGAAEPTSMETYTNIVDSNVTNYSVLDTGVSFGSTTTIQDRK